ncbi:SDR family NAD(P)-dependent oxidoreductase [Paraburkholderia caballeronis]|uniref:3-oxoacyl-[acyl-carrier protein] reductase n=1 Tax=Paraburkholderia caballeronis TaxID=416943 RepID=A0A1H7S413_9BURK|nr:SDR family NAD(P)-dependent oxidoreductase [Paraburkholderia caballeronis]PXW22858.1 3-oxoacyl-[acyl-carrier protein] reductase [Paraburkholderia caballeronis]PXW97243.1 3-oxoacyl-[acyl-carrier protein] reductase [Paraburkholderia caballeronis]RAJ93763.1 3-oxoacyl-[acyl-carrier protein] reductase [Paraburkholderia caballeronis]SED59860.1 3-oxoacyl-[acyl-carrier protein] reductase [Paraburkholderia caballeronis]SEL67019.1 3-oxoacyl-[acyl-carrier protein] reductase [Paraburkholderia caballero
MSAATRGTPRYDFTGCVAVVTGGAQGIGAAIVRAFGDAGATTVSWDLSATDEAGHGYRVDVSDPATVERATAATLERHGRIDVLVNNAGYAGPTGPLEQSDPQTWARVIDVNLLGVYHVCRAVAPAMRAAGYGRIVNLASLAGKEGTPNASAYSAAKAGVIALTKSLGKELAQSGVLVNAIAPAAVETPLLQQMSAAHVQTMIDKSPLARLGTVDEVASLALWLGSAACTFNTGAVFDLSGGRATY